MLIENARGDQRLARLPAEEAQLASFVPLTHSLVVALVRPQRAVVQLLAGDPASATS